MYATTSQQGDYALTFFNDATANTALKVTFVLNATTNACQLNIAGTTITAAIASSNPNPGAAFFLFVDASHLGDMQPVGGPYYHISCGASMTGMLMCSVDRFPNLNSLQVQINSGSDHELAIVPNGVYTTHTPALIQLVPA
jgi:hypothetical protein